MLIGTVFPWKCSSFGYVNRIKLISPKLLLRIKTALKNHSNITVLLHDISQITFSSFYYFEIVLRIEMGTVCIIKYFGAANWKKIFLRKKIIYSISFPRSIFYGIFIFIPTLEEDRFPKVENLLVGATYARLTCFILIISACFPDDL